MMSREITQEYLIGKSPDAIFDALITPGKIKKWWFANNAIVLPEEGGVYAVTWGDDIDNPETISVAKIASFERPVRLLLTDFRYKSKEGDLPFETDMPTEFRLEDMGGKTKLTVCQTGFPDEKIADEFYKLCVQGWIDTLTSLKKTVEESE
jgi:uncharacterized protein YndB with AHSA1/START domain